MYKINSFHVKFDIWYITCFKRDIILEECCLVHAYNTLNGVEKKTKHK